VRGLCGSPQRADDGELLEADTIEYEGKLWIVPEWLAGPTKGTEMPARIICLAAFLIYDSDWRWPRKTELEGWMHLGLFAGFAMMFILMWAFCAKSAN